MYESHEAQAIHLRNSLPQGVFDVLPQVAKDLMIAQRLRIVELRDRELYMQARLELLNFIRKQKRFEEEQEW